MKRTRGDYPPKFFVKIFEEKITERVSRHGKEVLFEEMTQEMEKISWVKTDTKMMKVMSVLYEKIEVPWEVDKKEFEDFMKDMNSSDSEAAEWIHEFIIAIVELTEHFYYSNRMERLLFELSSESEELPRKDDIVNRTEQMTEFIHELNMLVEDDFMKVMETYTIFVYNKVVTEEKSQENKEIFIETLLTCKTSCNKLRGEVNKLFK
jgi:hypothetical protein